MMIPAERDALSVDVVDYMWEAERMKWFNRSRRDPLWQDEFSINRADEQYVSRRQFTKFLVLTSLGMFVGNVWILARSCFSGTPAYPRRNICRTTMFPSEVCGCSVIRRKETRAY